MKEEFLHYIWKYKLFTFDDLQTTKYEKLEILKFGLPNLNSGPDFLNASIKIDGQEWFGNIEIHINASDWYAHNHEIDTNYDAVILHVVWEDDVEVFSKNNITLPTLVLKDKVEESLQNNFFQLLKFGNKWIGCESAIAKVSPFVLENWKERLYFERLERKTFEIKIILEKNSKDFEAALFVLLCKNFGLKVNGEGFLQLATSFNFKVLKKVRTNKLQLAALLFGQAGFLNEDIEDGYYKLLQKEYDFIKLKFGLTPIEKQHFSFFRMRPINFPTIRIAQIVELYFKNEHLFLKLITLKNKKDFYDFFKIDLQGFWENHYTFQKISQKKSKKNISTSFVDLLIINTIIPLKLIYQQDRGEFIKNEYIKLLKEINPEKNAIVDKFKSLEIVFKNALDSQSFIHLKNNYCDKKKCLHCAVGQQMLKI